MSARTAVFQNIFKTEREGTRELPNNFKGTAPRDQRDIKTRDRALMFTERAAKLQQNVNDEEVARSEAASAV